MPQRFGDFATWTGAIGTVLAFGMAFLQLHKEKGHRLAREREERHLLKREHADRVSAWISDGELVVTNQSGHPIQEIEIAYRMGETSHEEESDIVQAGAETARLPFLVPGETVLPVPAGVANQIPFLTFTDARGHRWHRPPGNPPTLTQDG